MSWSYEWTNDVGPDDDYYIEFFEIKNKEGIVIGTMEEKSDARLAAAAPDLLYALQEFLRNPGGDNTEQIAEDAINKALGENK